LIIRPAPDSAFGIRRDVGRSPTESGAGKDKPTGEIHARQLFSIGAASCMAETAVCGDLDEIVSTLNERCITGLEGILGKNYRDGGGT
jgi:hypothetical protein